jgi:uncharacterized membrane protein YccF (DUF307 family)
MAITTIGPTVHVRQEPGVPFVIRVLWFFLVGWHVTLWWILAAWILNLTIIGMLLGLWMLNRTPMVLTLRMPRSRTVTTVQNGQVVDVRQGGVQQLGWLLRFLYFLLVGWWFSLIWSLLGWLFCITIIGLPLGTWMLNRLPNVTTLMRQ